MDDQEKQAKYELMDKQRSVMLTRADQWLVSRKVKGVDKSENILECFLNSTDPDHLQLREIALDFFNENTSRVEVGEMLVTLACLSIRKATNVFYYNDSVGRLCEEGGRKDSRSPHTVESYMRTLKVALNWAHSMQWLPNEVRFRVIETEQMDCMKGRPITAHEFKLMLQATRDVRKRTHKHWRFFLRGLWESGLRLEEAVRFSWDDETAIRPVRTKSGHVCLQIPPGDQKNRKSQFTPTIPAFGRLISKVAECDRFGPVFPLPRERQAGFITNIDHVSHIVADIGREADIKVHGAKFATAHDLRRSFGQRMADAGMPPRDLQAMMRHEDFKTTEKYYLRDNATEQAERIAAMLEQPYLGTVDKNGDPKIAVS